jgi:hypothetical protein
MLSPDERGEVIAHLGRSARSPGPAAYRVPRALDEPGTPAIRLRGRPSTAAEVDGAPYYSVRGAIGGATPIALHGRPRERAPDAPPGPSYLPPPFGRGARRSGFAGPSHGLPGGGPRRSAATPLGGRRGPDETPGPGPGRYLTRGADFAGGGARGAQMKGGRAAGGGDPGTPGPAAYRPRYDKVLPAAPRPALGARTRLPEREPTPGYRDIGSTLGGPRFTIKARADDAVAVV